MPVKGSGLVGELGLDGRRGKDRLAYDRAYQEANRDKNNEYARSYYHEYVKNNPKRVAARAKSLAASRRKAKYGLSKEEFANMVAAQEGKCLICSAEKGKELRVDHDHVTGEIRGLLCGNCNSGLGMFKDDLETIQKALDYIKRTNRKGEGNQ